MNPIFRRLKVYEESQRRGIPTRNVEAEKAWEMRHPFRGN